MRTMEPIDGHLKQMCMDIDGSLHKWTTRYAFALDWLEQCSKQGFADVMYVRVALPAQTADKTARAIRIPAWMEVGDVGIEIDGSFVPMTMSEDMVLALDSCGDLVATGSGHPDQYPEFVDGNPEYVVRWHEPAYGDSRPVRGVWRIWRDIGILQVDGLSTHASILVRTKRAVFTPGTPTRVDSRGVMAMKAYTHWREREVAHKSAPRTVSSTDVEIARQEYLREMGLYTRARNAKPLSYIIEAVVR